MILFPSLKLGNSQISRVYSYKYLGLTFTCTLSWLVHINQTISKAKRFLGLIYRQFYHYSSSSTLLSLYTTIVRSILEYGSTIWDPSSPALSTSVEKVQFFALKIISKTWSTSYSNLLSSVNISSLEHRRRSELLLFFKLSNNLHFISSFPCHRFCKPEYALRHYSIFVFSQLFCPIYLISFSPSTIKLWNSLPSSTKSLISNFPLIVTLLLNRSTISVNCFSFVNLLISQPTNRIAAGSRTSVDLGR